VRLWSIHPGYLDARGLVALWREALLAQKVLQGLTKGYRRHPQLNRFWAATDPVAAVGVYLHAVADEADKRRYRFDRRKIVCKHGGKQIPVTSGQLSFELHHLACKLKQRNPGGCARLPAADNIEPHPLFYRIDGDIEAWEVMAPE
jgi:hypothetical protein